MQNIYSKFSLAWLIVALSSSVYAATPDAKTITLQGNNKGAIACIACHGQQGEGNASAGYPYLAGLPADYFENQLQAFTNGSRVNAIMKPIAGGLSAEEITAIAKYYAAMPNPKLAVTNTANTTKNPVAERLVSSGKWQSGMPACYKCHGENGTGVAPHFPPIVGQPYNYLRAQLNDWKSGKRKNDPLGLMQSVVKALDQPEIDALAKYLSDQNTK
jgi:thiosulfate dehydrogenase